MKLASIIIFIMAAVCLLIVVYLYYIFRGEDTQDQIVEGTILEYRTENTPTMEKPVVSFVIGGEETQAYADSVPAKGRPEIGTKVKLAVRRQPLPENENNWHAAVISEEKGLPFIQVVFYGLIVISIIMVIVGLFMLFI